MMRPLIVTSTVVLAVVVTSSFGAGCGAPSSPPADAGSNGGGGHGDAGGGDADSGAQTGADGGEEEDGGTSASDAGVDGGAGACAPFGRYGVPQSTFTIEGPNASGDLYLPDVQAKYPDVDWSTLDRLYIPAGTYGLINLGNLPHRTAQRPLVITNKGGQVFITPPQGRTQGYVWVLSGGSNWILTGRYDPQSQTGDVAFPGHRCGAYAQSRGRYGFLSDDDFRSGGHMGLSITNATDFEVEFVEITRAGFAGLRVNNSKLADGGVAPIENVRLHDLYIHDTESEAVYFGSTQAPPTPLVKGLRVYNNRFVRSGTESLQVQNLGDGTEIHHNVMAFGAIDWRAAFQRFQDNNSQAQVRSGTIRFHHNVFLGGAGALLNFFSGAEASDGPRHVEFTDNYFADTLSLGVYMGGTSDPASTYLWERNAFGGLDFGYDAVYPTATDPGVIFRVGNLFNSPVTLKDNTWEGARRWAQGITGGDGTSGVVTATGNINAAVAPFEFVDSGLPTGTPTRRLEMWTDVATLAPNAPEVTYPAGMLVMHDGELYEALSENTNKPPPDHPAIWKKLPLPADDLRTKPGTIWSQKGVGLLDAAP